MERKLAAILAADVVGYSRLMAADETGTHGRLKALRQDFIEPLVAEHKGRIVKLMGDGALVEFASIVDAVECAVVIQQGVAERQAELPENQRIVFRIGLTIGDIIVEDNDIHGDGVNVAARLEAIAEPGGISISRNVAEQIGGKLDVFLEDTGPQELKNIDRPVEVFRVRAPSTSVGSAIDVSQPVPGFGGRPAIAVLPFENLSQDPDQEFFAAASPRTS
jgi:adenylate cyclase